MDIWRVSALVCQRTSYLVFNRLDSANKIKFLRSCRSRSITNIWTDEHIHIIKSIVLLVDNGRQSLILADGKTAVAA